MLVLAWMPLYRLDRVLRPGRWSMREYIEFHFRQYVLFVLAPFLAMVTVVDLIRRLPGNEWLAQTRLDVVIALVAMAGVFVFAPLVLRSIWKTRRLEEGPLRQKLEDLSRHAGMGQRDILVWETMGGHIVNACVMGILAPVRFVLITDALMDTLSQEEIKAVFAHEIGHVRCHHMVYYVLFALGFFGIFFMLSQLSFLGGKPRELWGEMLSLQDLVLLILAGLYWGLAFGLVSRRTEMEADLYAVELTGSTGEFVTALESISFASGRPRTSGSWRHFSIARRTEFLLGCETDPARIERFRKSMRIQRGIIIGLAAASLAGAVLTFLLTAR
jgi:Zn-dependent protease with chaperone function